MSMPADSVVDVFQGVLAMQAARLHHCENPFDEPAARLAVATEAAPSPQYGTTHETLDVVVGRLNTLMRHECPQRRFQRQQVLAKLSYARIIAQPAFYQRFAQPTLQRFDQRLQFSPRDFPFLKRMPRGEDFFDNSKPATAHKNTGAAAIDNFLKIAFQVLPAKLSPFLGHLQIHMPAVAVQDTVDLLAQESSQAQGAAFGVDDKDSDVGGCPRPQPAHLAPKFPTRLVGERHVG